MDALARTAGSGPLSARMRGRLYTRCAIPLRRNAATSLHTVSAGWLPVPPRLTNMSGSRRVLQSRDGRTLWAIFGGSPSGPEPAATVRNQWLRPGRNALGDMSEKRLKARLKAAGDW